jgi:hypothetical protein
MSIKTRLKNIEKARFVKEPWLVFTALKPTDEQLADIEKAKRTGRFVVAFHPITAQAWIIGSDIQPWWEGAGEDELIH